MQSNLRPTFSLHLRTRTMMHSGLLCDNLLTSQVQGRSQPAWPFRSNGTQTNANGTTSNLIVNTVTYGVMSDNKAFAT